VIWSCGRSPGGHGRPWPPGDERWEDLDAEIELEPAWADALDGLDGFSHIWVVWWPDRVSSGDTSGALHVRPEGREEMPEWAFLPPARPDAPTRLPSPLCAWRSARVIA